MILAFFAHMHIWALLVAEPGKACVSEHRFTNNFPVQSNLFNDLSYLPEQPSSNIGSCLTWLLQGRLLAVTLITFSAPLHKITRRQILPPCPTHASPLLPRASASVLLPEPNVVLDSGAISFNCPHRPHQTSISSPFNYCSSTHPDTSPIIFFLGYFQGGWVYAYACVSNNATRQLSQSASQST